jgi:hypothetical protein
VLITLQDKVRELDCTIALLESTVTVCVCVCVCVCVYIYVCAREHGHRVCVSVCVYIYVCAREHGQIHLKGVAKYYFKVFCLVTLCSEYPRALTFQTF